MAVRSRAGWPPGNGAVARPPAPLPRVAVSPGGEKAEDDMAAGRRGRGRGSTGPSQARERLQHKQPSRAVREGLSYLLSERLVIDVLCDPKVPRYVRDWIVRRIVDTSPGRMTVRDRRARIRALTRAGVEANQSVRRAWKDPDGRLWRGCPRTWPSRALAIWLGHRAHGDVTWKLYERKQPPRKKRSPLGPPRRTGSRTDGERGKQRRLPAASTSRWSASISR
jgi:hypothetical protein